METQRLFGASVATVTTAEAVDLIVRWAGEDRARTVVTMNLDHALRLRRDPAFARAYAAADLVTADGMPLVWLSRLHGAPLPERVTGADLVAPVVAAAARAGRSVYLLGTTAGRLERVAAAFGAAHPGLRIAGLDSPPFGFDRAPEGLENALRRLEAARPDIVFVALGAPKQETLGLLAAERLGRGVFLGVGAALDFLSADVARAPRLLQRAGLEWVWRAASSPGRLGRRYAGILVALPGLLLAHRRDRAAHTKGLSPRQP